VLYSFIALVTARLNVKTPEVLLVHHQATHCRHFRCWRRYLDQVQENYLKARENCVMKSIMICTAHQILLGWSSQRGWNWIDMSYIRGRR